MVSQTFGEYLKYLRAKKEPPMTQEELASAVGRNKMTISQFECGKNAPPQGDLLDAIVQALEITVQEEQHLKFLAAQARDTVPSDIQEYFFDNPSICDAIRAAQRTHRPDAEWEKIKEFFDGER